MPMAKETILLVDDEEDILELLDYNLSKEGFTILRVTTGEDALAVARKNLPDLVLLDLMLPGIGGLDVCRILKGDDRTQPIPIVMLTAKGEESDVVAGLELGASDYITKPFSPRVVVARVRAVLRRGAHALPAADAAVRFHNIEIHPGRREVRVDGASIDLTFTEFGILHFLSRHPGWVFTRYQIVEAVHGDDYAVTDRSIDVQIVSLRKKLGSAGSVIETVRGVGYRFKEDA
jgi:two-component system alkaline phosphatase synthesis response regulator PhoP